MDTEIESALARLRGARLVATGRGADLQWFTFESDATYALHVMCPWRLAGSGGLVTGRSDYWRPASPETPREDFERGAIGATLRDVRNRELEGVLAAGVVTVESFAVDGLGGFTLVLSAGYRLDVFPDESPAEHDDLELWRLFQPGKGLRHFVVRSNGVERGDDARGDGGEPAGLFRQS
ncbi:MAG TPA: hypothetical protein VF746_24955 [Longimicrobium sp.]